MGCEGRGGDGQGSQTKRMLNSAKFSGLWKMPFMVCESQHPEDPLLLLQEVTKLFDLAGNQALVLGESFVKSTHAVVLLV